MVLSAAPEDGCEGRGGVWRVWPERGGVRNSGRARASVLGQGKGSVNSQGLETANGLTDKTVGAARF